MRDQDRERQRRPKTEDERRFWHGATCASRYFTPRERHENRLAYPGWEPGCDLNGLIFERKLREADPPAHPLFAKLCVAVIVKGFELGLTWADKAEIVKPFLDHPQIGRMASLLYADLLRNYEIDPTPLPKLSEMAEGRIGRAVAGQAASLRQTLKDAPQSTQR
jgi:hypothetical protein